MAWVAGVDGAKAGWLTVLAPLAGGSAEAVLAPHWRDLPLSTVQLVAVDMPIGLPESGSRGCDIAARRILPRNRKSSVFPAPRRALLACASWEEANRRGRTLEGKGISRQAWSLAPKIRELDEALAPEDQAKVREAHPELVFLRLNGGNPVPRKTSPAGQAARLDLLARARLSGVEPLLRRFPRREVRPDDILDAAACAVAARDMSRGRAKCLPDVTQADARGLRMEIWY